MIKKFTTINDFTGQTKQTLENWIASGVQIQAGDWILFPDFGEPLRSVTAADYQAISELNQSVKEKAGADLMKTIFQALKDGAQSDADKHLIMKEVSYVLLGISMGKIQQARDLCAVIPVQAPFTNGVKNALLSMIDNTLSTL